MSMSVQPPGRNRCARAAVLRVLIVAASLAASGPAVAQTLSMDPAAPTAPPPPPVEPLPAATTPPPAGTMPPPAVAAPAAPAPPVTSAVVPPQADPPIVERWWFWTAIGAIAVTAVVILATQSGPSTPRTDLGNMPAF